MSFMVQKGYNKQVCILLNNCIDALYNAEWIQYSGVSFSKQLYW